MRIGSGERVKLDFRKDLYNHMIEELMEYAKVMKGKSSADEANRLINVIEKYVYLGTEKDGTEYAVIRLFPSDAGSLIGILAMVATSAIGEPADYYERLKNNRAAK